MKWPDLLIGSLLVIFLLTACQKPPETAESVVQKIVAAHGAEQALRAAHGLLFHGHIQALMQEDHGKVWILYRRPDQLRVIVQLEKSGEDRLYLAGKGWRDSGQGFVEVTGPALDVMGFQAEHLDLPFRLMAGEYSPRLLEEVVPDKPVRLALTDADGVETLIAVDPVRWVIRTVERELVMNGQSLKIGIVYEEYRVVKDIQLPLRILNYINGQPVGQTDFMSVQTNPSLPENVFSPPGTGAR